MNGSFCSWVIFGEPIAQGRPRACVVNGHARMYTPKRSDSWCGQAVETLAGRWSGGPCDRSVKVLVLAVFQRPKRLDRKRDPGGRIPHASKPDGDNVLKAVLDALVKAGVLRDDCQAQSCTIEKWYCARGEGPCVEIDMTAFGDALSAPKGKRKARNLTPLAESVTLAV